MKANAILYLVILGMAGTAMASGRSPELARYEYAEPHLGTQIKLVIYADRDPASLAKALFARVDELNKVYSDYDDTSELMRLCQSEPNRPQKVSTLLLDVLDHAQNISSESNGAFDVTVGPLSQVWRRARRQKQLPSEETIKRALALIGYQKLTLDRRESTVTLQLSGMRLDLGGIAKGYIGDQLMNVLRPIYPRSMIALGGDLVLGQPPPGEAGWKIQIGPADAKRGESLALCLANCAVSTSGDIEQYLEIDGKRYSHIIDPRTGWGQTASPLVTVIAKAGWEADALTKPLCLLSVETGLKIIGQHPGTAARWVLPPSEGRTQIVVSPDWPGSRTSPTK